jgi:hypothetical protein
MNLKGKKNATCLSCFNCKTRVFRNLLDLEAWGMEKEYRIRGNWIRDIVKYKKLRLYWCSKGYRNPRVFSNYNNPFNENCNEYIGL